MRKPVEHGNTTTSIILGASSIIIAILTKMEVISILFWVPIWLGLFLYDVPIRRVVRSHEDTLMFLLIVIISIFSIYLSHFLIFPYLIFLATYAARNRLAAMKLNFIGTGLGIFAYVLLFATTSGLQGHYYFLLVPSLFAYMIGSEFTVRSKLKRDRWLLVYDLFPPILSLLNPVFVVFSLSLVRIPVAIRSKGLKPVGITETLLLVAVTFTISFFYVLNR